MLQRSFVSKLISGLLFISCCVVTGRAQDTVMYRGGYYDGTVMAFFNAFSPQIRDQQYAFTGGNNDGYGVAKVNAFSPGPLSHYAIYAADTAARADGYAIAGYQNFNRSFLSQYTAYTSGMLGDGYAGYMVVNIPLPLDLIAFTGAIAGDAALLEWSVATEKSIVRYELERSRDGRTFAMICSRNVTNGMDAPVTRQYTDEQPFPGNGFYRLKIVGENGQYRYSNIVLLFFGGGGTSLAVFPNPAKEQISMKYQISWAGTACVVDMKGTVLKTIDMPAGSHTLLLPLGSLPAGAYLLNLFNAGGNVKTVRFVKE
jgi:hypothetical protein